MSASISLASRHDILNDYIKRNFIDSNTQFFSGRPFPWSNEDSPDLASADNKSEFNTRHAMIYIKQVDETNIIKAIKRFDWTTGVIYTRADTDIDYTYFRNWLTPESPYYCINSEGNVYLCISNNYNTPSTFEPTGTDYGMTITGDGYIWKFMFDLSAEVADQFLTDNWIPVPESIRRTTIHNNVIDAAIAGAIQFIRVDNSGINYTIAPTVLIEGDGSGCTAVALISGGKVTSIVVTDPGTGYTYANVKIFGQNSSAIATAMIPGIGGYGFDAVIELGALWLELSVELKGDSEDYPAWSSFRQIGLINDLRYDDNSPVVEPWGTTLSIIDVQAASGQFTANELIIGQDSEARGKLYYDVAGDDTDIYLYDVEGTFQDGEILYGQTSEVDAIFTALGTIYNQIDLSSGTLLYTENIKFITRNPLQIETFVLTVEF